MRLNLGCGNDVRLNYINIDKVAVTPDVRHGDFRNLNSAGIQNDSVEEILAIDIIQYIPLHELELTVNNWLEKLKTGGTVYLESTDSNMLGMMIAYSQVSLEVFNKILYNNQGESIKSLHNLCDLEHFLRSKGFKTVTKGYKGHSFYLTVSKV